MWEQFFFFFFYQGKSFNAKSEMCAAVLQTVLHKDPALCQVVLTEIPPFSVFKIVTEAIQIT